MKGLWEIFRKEVIDNLRDRRSVSTALLTPLITPGILVALIYVLGSSMFSDPLENALLLPVAGQENAPALMDFFRQNNVIVIDAPADPQAAVRDGQVNVVVVVPDDYAYDLAAGRPASVRIIMDTSRTTAMSDSQTANQLVQQYSSMVGMLRLQARGVDPLITTPVIAEPVDVSTPQAQTILFLNMLPFLLLMTIFSGGMYAIIDSTAGERERGSLEPLLINPVPRWQVVIGKLLASLPFALAALVLTLTTLYLAFSLIPFEDVIGYPMVISLQSIWRFFLLSLSVLVLASGLQMLVAAYTRSFKEAQTYLGFLPLVAGLPSLFLAFSTIKPSLVTMLIPGFSQSLLINQILRGETVVAENVIISTLSTLVLTVVVLAVAIRFYQRERILFGR